MCNSTHGVSHSPASSETAGKGTAGTREASPPGSAEGRGAGRASPTPRRVLADSLVAFWSRAGAHRADDPRGPAPSSVAPRSPTSGPRDNRGSPHHPRQQGQAHPLPQLAVKDKQRWVGRVRHPAGVVRRLGGYLSSWALKGSPQAAFPLDRLHVKSKSVCPPGRQRLPLTPSDWRAGTSNSPGSTGSPLQPGVPGEPLSAAGPRITDRTGSPGITDMG